MADKPQRLSSRSSFGQSRFISVHLTLGLQAPQRTVSSAKFPVNWEPNSNFRVYATGAKFGTSRVWLRLDEDNPPSQRPHKESRRVHTTTSGKVLEIPPSLRSPCLRRSFIHRTLNLPSRRKSTLPTLRLKLPRRRRESTSLSASSLVMGTTPSSNMVSLIPYARSWIGICCLSSSLSTFVSESRRRLVGLQSHPSP
jgi:hypothetical protein